MPRRTTAAATDVRDDEIDDVPPTAADFEEDFEDEEDTEGLGDPLVGFDDLSSDGILPPGLNSEGIWDAADDEELEDASGRVEIVDAELERRVDEEIVAADERMEEARNTVAESEPIGIAENLPGQPPVTGLIVQLFLDDIVPDPAQPRLEVDDELAASIAANGVLQPVVVRRRQEGDAALHAPYVLVDGERRWRGAAKADLTVIPARVDERPLAAGDRLLEQVTLNEGKRLAPMEEAKAWKRIMDAKGWTIQQLATALGRAKSTVSDRLAMLDAPAPFQELLAKGLLTAAAAPILREYREIPERILKSAVKALVEDEYDGWAQYIDGGVPVPLDAVKDGLTGAILFGDDPETHEPLVLEMDKALAKAYTGPVATVKGKKYALDVEAYCAVRDAQRPASTAGSDAAPARREPSQYEIEQRERLKKEAAALARKRALRGAQFNAIAAKLPSSLDANWALLLVTWLTREVHHDTQRVLCKALGLEPKKSAGTYGGYDFQGTIVREAEKLAAPARVKFALTLLLAHDLVVSQWDTRGAQRFEAAAKLLKVDLAKVKAPAAAKPAKKTTAKKGSK